MSRAAVPFRQADIARAVKGAKAAGMDVQRVEIDRDGRITISTAAAAPSPANDLDKWMEKHPDARPS